ncbi:MAG: hypothetical protein Q7J09_02860 [Methanocalculus sp.]|uniref:hypothetical protein n=1 Tax=Methanocalculus sp. TaxID=2004547 RepID=UPI002727EA76|nr:hypothetical protein [Methanocalculus sp.]MDO9538930.1 hypothetical protein [Methanocalculus sp.]
MIDPAKVVRIGLQNAGSIAGMILYKEVIIKNYDDEKDQKTQTIIISSIFTRYWELQIPEQYS